MKHAPPVHKCPRRIEVPAGAAEVHAAFRQAGISISEWARAHGFHRMTVVDVLRGQRKGTRGEAHRVAIALGLKAGTVCDVKAFRPGALNEQK